ncbi:MAG: hypothetical protein ACM3UO_00230 [Bacillota bacterium]
MADLFTPAVCSDTDLADPNGRLAFWKQILPKKSIHYTGHDGKRHTINFDDAYLHDLAKMDGIDKVGFLLADKNNAHTMDPERYRGTVEKMEVRADGLYGKIVFPNKEAASAVLNNPELGVSARIREGIHKSDGTTVARGIIHVLGTLDPQVSGMKAWETADLSMSEVDVLDLSTEEYEDADMANKKKALKDYTDEDVNAMSEEELDSFLAEFAPEFDGTLGAAEDEETDEADEADEDEESEEDENEDEKPKGELVGAGADMSKEMQDSIDLANSRAASAEKKAQDAINELNLARWEKTKADYLAAGVPAHALDLAAPVLSVGPEMVIDLSNAEGTENEIDMAKIVTGLLDEMKGFIDLSAAAGHSGTASLTDTEKYDEEVGALWDLS